MWDKPIEKNEDMSLSMSKLKEILDFDNWCTIYLDNDC